MTNEILQQILDFITKNAQLIGSAAFQLALRQIYYYAIADVVSGFLIFLIGVSGAIASWKLYKNRIKKAWKKYDKDVENHPTWNTSRPDEDMEDYEVCLGVFGAITSLCGVVTMLMSLRYFINPNWYAIQLLIQQIR